MSIESVMPSKHLILLSPSPPAFNLTQHHPPLCSPLSAQGLKTQEPGELENWWRASLHFHKEMCSVQFFFEMCYKLSVFRFSTFVGDVVSV